MQRFKVKVQLDVEVEIEADSQAAAEVIGDNLSVGNGGHVVFVQPSRAGVVREITVMDVKPTTVPVRYSDDPEGRPSGRLPKGR